jgi:hypothetical protein
MASHTVLDTRDAPAGSLDRPPNCSSRRASVTCRSGRVPRGREFAAT